MAQLTPECDHGLCPLTFAMKAPGFMMVGPSGQRFVNEDQTTRHGLMNCAGTYRSQPAVVPAYGIFDSAYIATKGRIYPQFSADNSHEVENGYFIVADTLEELAQKLYDDMPDFVRQPNAPEKTGTFTAAVTDCLTQASIEVPDPSEEEGKWTEKKARYRQRQVRRPAPVLFCNEAVFRQSVGRAKPGDHCAGPIRHCPRRCPSVSRDPSMMNRTLASTPFKPYIGFRYGFRNSGTNSTKRSAIVSGDSTMPRAIQCRVICLLPTLLYSSLSSCSAVGSSPDFLLYTSIMWLVISLPPYCTSDPYSTDLVAGTRRDFACSISSKARL